MFNLSFFFYFFGGRKGGRLILCIQCFSLHLRPSRSHLTSRLLSPFPFFSATTFVSLSFSPTFFFLVRFNRADVSASSEKKKKLPSHPLPALACCRVCNGPLNFIEILKFNDNASLYFKSPVFLSGCTWLPPARLHLGSWCVFSGRLEEFYAAALC